MLMGEKCTADRPKTTGQLKVAALHLQDGLKDSDFHSCFILLQDTI